MASFEEFRSHPSARLCDTCLLCRLTTCKQAAQKIAGFLNTLNKLGGLRLKYRISAGDGARDAEGRRGAPDLNVELAGPDVPLVIQHNGELLRALETLAAQMLRLDHHEHDLVSFDAAQLQGPPRPGAAPGRRNRRGEGPPVAEFPTAFRP